MTVASTLCEKFSHSKKRLAVEGLLCQHSEYFRSDVLQCQLSQWYSTQKAETQILKKPKIRDGNKYGIMGLHRQSWSSLKNNCVFNNCVFLLGIEIHT